MATTGAPPATVVLHTGGLSYSGEAAIVERALGKRPGVIRVEANPVSQTATVTFDTSQTSVAALMKWVEECGYHCAGQSVPAHLCDAMEEPVPGAHHGEHTGHMTAATPMPHGGPGEMVMSPAEAMGHGGHAGMSMASMVRDMRNRFLVAAALSVPIVLWSSIGRNVLHFTTPAPLGLRDDLFQLLLSLPVVLYSSWIFFDGAVRALRNRTLDMMVLVAIAIGAGWTYSLVVSLTGGGEVFYEAASVLATFVLLGHWFEMRARGGANDAIQTLLDLAPPTAAVIRNGKEFEIPTGEVVVGDLLLLRPGSKVPVDAVVEEGQSEVDESMVTGESLPVSKAVGAKVIGGSINKDGTLRARAERVGSETALAQIVKLVQEAQNSKAPGQRLADRAAFWLVLVALIGGSATFGIWLLTGATVQTAILFAITVVVITCPDALGLATPTAIMVGTGLGANRGILFKNAVALETSARIQVVVFDKTGTLTKGEPAVVELIASSISEPELLRLASAVERESEHPLAQAIVKRAEAAGAGQSAAINFVNVPGHGALAAVDGHRVAVGNARLLDQEHVSLNGIGPDLGRLSAEGRTVVAARSTGKPPGSLQSRTRLGPRAGKLWLPCNRAGSRSRC